MSYILDALRRLEQDKERTKKGANPMEAVLVPDVQGGERSIRRRLWWSGTGAVLLVIAVATTYWMTRRALVLPVESATRAAIPNASSSRPDYSGSVPAPSAETTSSAVHPGSPESEPALPSVEGSAPSRARLPSSRRKPVESVASPPSMKMEEERRAVVSPSPETVSLPPGNTAARREMPEDETIEDWAGSDIKINAIAYSRDDKRRFAVVNLKTVREGDQCEGLSVVEIRENSIVFEKEGKRYRVLLGRR